MRNCFAILRKSIILSVLPLFTAAAYAQAPALDELLPYQGETALEIPAAVPAPAETYPDLEQDRKPAKLISSAGGARVIGGVRFERDPQANTYAWRDLSIEDSKLEEVYFGYRSGGTGHNFLLFTFKDGAKSDGRTVRGFVAEVLPWKKKGEEFEPFTAGISGKTGATETIFSYPYIRPISSIKSHSSRRSGRRVGTITSSVFLSAIFLTANPKSVRYFAASTKGIFLPKTFSTRRRDSLIFTFLAACG